MSLKSFEIKALSQVAEIRLTGEIDWWTNSGQEFMHQIDGIIASGIKNAKLYVNCLGGSTFEAAEIINQLKRFDSVTVKIGAIAASAATFIAVCFNSSIARNGLFMIHNPEMTMRGGEKEFNSALQLLQITKDNLIQAYVDKTGLSKSVITQMMDAETWMNATIAKEKGFVDSIDNEDANWEGISNSYKTKVKQVNAHAGLLHINTIKNLENQPEVMNRTYMIACLNKAGKNLSTDASELQIEEAFSSIVNHYESLQTNYNTLLNQRVDEILIKACNENKIGQSQFEMFRKLAMSDFLGTKSILDQLPSVQRATRTIEESKGEENTVIQKPKSEWTLEDYRKHAPNELKNNADLYNRLIEKQYGKNSNN